jgi:hypothetical protein
MSFGSQYNLNQRLTYLEYLLNNLPPFPPTSTLGQVLNAGNIASKEIDMNGKDIVNVSQESFSSGINISDSGGSIQGNNSDILTVNYNATSFIPNPSSSLSISQGGILAGVSNPAFGDDIYDCVLDPENSISINSYNNVTYDQARSILTTSSLKVGNNPNTDSSTGTIYCGEIDTNSIKGKSFLPLSLTSTDVITLNSSDNTTITSGASVVLNAFDNINLNSATIVTSASNQLIVTDGVTSNTINQLGYTTRNSVQNSAHYLNFSDNSTTGIGAIQKTAGISCNPSLNSITASVFNGALNGTASSSTTSTKADTLAISSSSSNVDYKVIFGTDTASVLTAFDNTNLTYNPSQQLLGINWPSGLNRAYLSNNNMRVGSSVGTVGTTESFCNLYAGGGSFESYTLNTDYGSPILDIVNKNSTSTINQGVPAITLKKNGRAPLLNDKVGQIFFASNNGVGNGVIDIANITGVVSNNVIPISGQIDFNANNSASPVIMFRMDGNLLKNTSFRPLDMNNQTISNASTITATSFSGQYTLGTASGNSEFNLVLSSASSGAQSLKGSPSDLTYNPSTQILTVKNMNVSGNENQTGIITTNVLKTDIMLQQVSYFSTQTLTIATVADLKAYGTFFMSQFDSGSIIANSIITINLPTLPTDGSLDGYTFQLRKLRGGVNQTSTNWTVNSTGGAFLIPNGNSLNVGSGGTNSTSNLNSFTQRYTIITYLNVGYYIGCAT